MSSIWPKNEKVSGDTLIPVIWIIGATGTGKTTFGITVAPAKPGDPPKTVITDLEGSAVAISRAFSVEIIEPRKLAAERHGPGYSLKNLYTTWYDTVMAIPAGKYSVLVVDPISDLAIGSHQWVKENPRYFSKPDGAYNGRDGTIFAWGDVRVLWKQIITELTYRFETVVLCSHVKDVYTNQQVTGKGARGIDFKEIATLVLWLTVENNKRWALVEKSRLQHAIWEDAQGNPLTSPLVADVLPKRLELKSGQTYPDLIRQYLLAPQPGYGELDQVVGYDPSKPVLSEEERILIQAEANTAAAERLRAELALRLQEAKAAMVKRLVPTYYESPLDITKALKRLALLDDAQDIDKLPAIELALIEDATGSNGQSRP